MPESMKNRNVYPIGTRVRIAQDKFRSKTGTVVEHCEENESSVYVHWDNDPEWMIHGPFSPAQLKEC